MRVNFLGAPVDALDRLQVMEAVRSFFDGRTGRKVFTPNPEILVAAWKDRSFCDTLRKGDLNIPDGVGIVLLAKFLGQSFPERVTGTDLMDLTCGLAARHGRSVFLLGGKSPGVAERAAERMRVRHERLCVAGAMNGGEIPVDEGGEPVLRQETERAIRSAAPDVLFVALGQVKQEKWIVAHLRKFPSVKMAVGVGGAFDFWSGDVRRAPALLQKVGLEWLWRLAMQPHRIGRIFTATVVFPTLVLAQRFGIIKFR